MEHLELPAASFDLAYSSLAFHYIEDLRRLMSQVHRSLVAGGRLVFSVEHPIFTGAIGSEILSQMPPVVRRGRSTATSMKALVPPIGLRRA